MGHREFVVRVRLVHMKITHPPQEDPLATETQEDLAELEFAPITNAEAIEVADRTYLFGVHVDAVRGR
jgi:hypothetical protein